MQLRRELSIAVRARRGRLRRTTSRPSTMLEPNAAAEKQDRVTHAVAPPSRSTSVMCCGFETPAGTAGPFFALPDGNRGFRVHRCRTGPPANASSRCGAETTAITADSPTGTTPVRWISATRRTVVQRMPHFGGDGRKPGHDLLVVGLILEYSTPSRPGEWSRAVPENSTTAPQSGRTAQA